MGNSSNVTGFSIPYDPAMYGGVANTPTPSEAEKFQAAQNGPQLYALKPIVDKDEDPDPGNSKFAGFVPAGIAIFKKNNAIGDIEFAKRHPAVYWNPESDNDYVTNSRESDQKTIDKIKKELNVNLAPDKQQAENQFTPLQKQTYVSALKEIEDLIPRKKINETEARNSVPTLIDYIKKKIEPGQKK